MKLNNYRIVQYTDGYHLEQKERIPRKPYRCTLWCLDYEIPLSDKIVWTTIGIFKTLKAARKEKLRLELITGKVIE